MHNNVFEKIKKINEYGSEHWFSRELYKILTYSSYRNFLVVVEKAKLACKNSQQDNLHLQVGRLGPCQHNYSVCYPYLLLDKLDQGLRQVQLLLYLCGSNMD